MWFLKCVTSSSNIVTRVLNPCDVIDFTMKSMKKRHTVLSVAAQMDAATMYPARFHDDSYYILKLAALFSSALHVLHGE